MFDIKLIDTKYVDLYLSNIDIGLGINYTPEHKALSFRFIVLELTIYLLSKTHF